MFYFATTPLFRAFLFFFLEQKKNKMLMKNEDE